MRRTKNQNRLYRLLSDVLNIPAAKISDDLSPENTQNWDSFNNISIASKLQNTFEVKLSLKDIQNINSVADIKKVLSKHKIDF